MDPVNVAAKFRSS